MRRFLTLTAAAALVAAFGFAAGPAQAHDSIFTVAAGNDHAAADPSYDCKAEVSGSYLGEDNVAHGKASELGKIASQGRFNWVFDANVCNSSPGLVLDGVGLSVTRAANGSLVFVEYDSGSNCASGGPEDAIVDIAGEVTGGTGNFEGVSGQLVHTISKIFVTAGDFNFGGTVTVSENQCLDD